MIGDIGPKVRMPSILIGCEFSLITFIIMDFSWALIW